MMRPPPRSTLFPHPPLFRSNGDTRGANAVRAGAAVSDHEVRQPVAVDVHDLHRLWPRAGRNIHSREEQDRKSTRLNSSHLVISYAVFCLKKKNELTFKTTSA